HRHASEEWRWAAAPVLPDLAPWDDLLSRRARLERATCPAAAERQLQAREDRHRDGPRDRQLDELRVSLLRIRHPPVGPGGFLRHREISVLGQRFRLLFGAGFVDRYEFHGAHSS